MKLQSINEWKEVRSITLLLTNTRWYDSIERAYCTFTNPKTKKTVTIRKSPFRWGIDIVNVIGKLIDGNTAHTNKEVKVTYKEMEAIKYMAEVSNKHLSDKEMESQLTKILQK